MEGLGVVRRRRRAERVRLDLVNHQGAVGIVPFLGRPEEEVLGFVVVVSGPRGPMV